MQLTRFKALTFDCYGTLIDWEAGILAALRPWTERHQVSLNDAQLLTLFAESETRHQQAEPDALYPIILSHVFNDIAERCGIKPGPGDAGRFAGSIRDWPAFPDSRSSLTYLKDYYRLAIISNIDRESFRYSNDKLGVEFDLIVTAQDVGSYKPDPRNFQVMIDRLAEIGIERDQILHCAQSLYHDHLPARTMGLATCWVNRYAGRAGATPSVEDVEVDFEVPDLAALVHQHRQEMA